MPGIHLRRSRRAVSAVFTLNGVVLASWVPHIPAVKARLGIGDGELGLVLLAMAAGAVCALSLAGWLVARFGSLRMTRLAATGLCLALPLPVAMPSVPLVAAGLFVLGACNGALDVSMNAQAVLVERRWGAAIMSSFHGLFSLGGVAGAVLAWIALGAGMAPLRHVLLTSAAGLLVLAVASTALVADAGRAAVGPVLVRPTGRLLGLGALAFMALMAEGAMADWSAVWLHDVLAADAGRAAAGFAAFSLAMAAGRLGGDALVRRLAPTRLLQASGGLAALGLGGALAAGRAEVAIVGCALVGCGVANMFPVLLSAAGRWGGSDTGRALAAVTSTGYLGFLAGPPAIGLVAERCGLPVGLGVVSLACALVAAAAPRVLAPRPAPALAASGRAAFATGAVVDGPPPA